MKKIISFIFIVNSLFAQSVYEGLVYSKQDLELSMQLDGVVSKIYHQDGDKVKKNEPILKLDDSLQSLQVQIKRVILNDDSEYIANKSNLETLKDILDSTKALYEKNYSVSKEELNNLQMQYQNLKAKVDAFKARKKQQKVEYKIAKEVLSRYTLKSPIDGIVKDLNYDEGEWVNAGKIVVVVVDKYNCYVELNIDENIARDIKPNTKVKILSNQDKIKKDGTVYYISPSAEVTSSFVKVRVKFKNDAPTITPGVVAKVVFDI
jgi:RND family efflux transporter MFP subunit